MITISILSAKQVKAIKAYYHGSNKQFAEGTTIDTQATEGLKRIAEINSCHQLLQIERLGSYRMLIYLDTYLLVFRLV
jgi:hypothetical protein